jgi:hypothetical protein
MSCAPYRIITVEFIYPPIPDRRFDYQATFDGYEPGCPLGHGPTEQAAIDDLHEQIEDELDFAESMRSPQGRSYMEQRHE